MARSRSEFSVAVAVAVVAVMVVMVATGFVEAQAPDCASKLAACAGFLKSDNPPATCCDPIKQAVATQLDCLCNLYTSPDFLPSIGVNVSDALHLTQACGVPVDLAKCKTAAPAPEKGSPPAVPGNDAHKFGSTGFTSLLLFLAASLIFY